VDERDLIELLAGGVKGAGSRWADLGAGEGAFTLALAQLLGPGAHITAVDKDGGALRRLTEQMGRRFPETGLEVKVTDFTKPLGLHGLDGIVMANSLHFVRDKRPVLNAVMAMLNPSGRLILVEYGSDRGNPWVPHPMSFPTWQRLAAEAGFLGTAQLHAVPSRYLGSIYSAVSKKPER
jgi:ubiquinone/menaquinone biosynthesis C-methylase UbiE